jgi:hypothetical protein
MVEYVGHFSLGNKEHLGNRQVLRGHGFDPPWRGGITLEEGEEPRTRSNTYDLKVHFNCDWKSQFPGWNLGKN